MKQASFQKRLVEFLRRLRWMSTLNGNYGASLGVLLSIRRDMSAPQVLRTPSGDIAFRGTDEQALKEVLIDREYAFLDDVLAASETPHVLDVGAHIGTFALWVLGRNPRARVLSVEADPRTFELVERNAAVRRARGLNWSTVHAAAGARDGDVVRLSDDGPSMSHRVAADGRVEVSTASFASLLDRAAGPDGRIDLLKVDIEGSEEAFLCDTSGLLNRVGALVIELHPALCDTDRVRAQLAAHFDDISEVQGRYSSKPLLYCRRKAARAAA